MSYYAVIFSSKLRENSAGYSEMAKRMVDLSKDQPGFLGIESARNADGQGLTVSYWSTLEDIKNWKANSEHQMAQSTGKEKWYEHFKVRICRVEREYGKDTREII